MNPETLTVVQVIVTRLLLPLGLGSIVGIGFKHWLDRRSQRQDLLRAKLEEAHEACHSICYEIRKVYIPYLDLFRGDATLDEVAEAIEEADKKRDTTEFRRLDALIHIYAPDAEGALRNLPKVINQARDIELEFRRR